MFRKSFFIVRMTVLFSALLLGSFFAEGASSSPPSGFQRPPAIQKRDPAAASRESTVSYDINAAAGTYNSVNYYELNIGLNWLVADWLNWRNALFSRIPSTGSDSVTGLDSSLRLQGSMLTDSGTFGMSGFIGPGLRFASKDSNAVFGEAGLLFKLGGLNLGGGVKSLYYLKDRTDTTTGATMPKNDSQFFILISGSGNL